MITYKKICETCKDAFIPKSTRKQKFCSRKCMAIGQTGINNPHYKGGHISKVSGYKELCINGEKILEHRYVIENHIGRKLTSDEHIHHKNGNKLDNRVENLEITNRTNHGKLHTKLYKDNLQKECGKCHEIKLFNMFSPNHTWCKKCRAHYSRERLRLGITVQWRDRHKIKH